MKTLMIDWGWFRRRWWDFRFGHSTYLAFALSFINFIVINYNLLGLFQKIFPNLILFGISFIATYIPLATAIGYKWHRKRQLPTDQEIAILANPYLYKAMPGKELTVNLPLMRLGWILRVRMWEKMGILKAEEKREFERLIKLIEKLMKGETIENHD